LRLVNNLGQQMIFQRLLFAITLNLLFSLNLTAAPVSKYLPAAQNYKTTVPTPQQDLGFGLGERHIRHAQLTHYFNSLAQTSERVKLTAIGQTNEFRSQFLVTISTKENLANLTTILADRKKPQANSPLVIWLGYSIHGDEISGANAAMIVAYHLAASQNKSVENMLANTVIVMEPSMNPDGMDKFVNWVTMFRGKTANADPQHIEHHQGWFTGRTNHYGFDLNRDWLLLSQKESQNRLKYFHLYNPNVLADFHEMSANSSYFFQPGVPSRTNELTPKATIELTNLLANYHAKALDSQQRLYFSQESFDDFYYGKGSTYPDINASVGILFEQASSRGYQQQSENGLLTLEFAIQNHVLTSLSTIEGAWQNRTKLAQYRAGFYQQAEKAANKEKFSGYLIHQGDDIYRLNAFLDKLNQHQIKVYRLASDFRNKGTVYNAQDSYFVPIVQPQYRLIQALFAQPTDFKNNTFYDVSGWTMPLAMNISFDKVERTWGLKLDKKPWQPITIKLNKIEHNAYAYAFEWHDFLAPKLLNTLLTQGIKTRVATKTFTSTTQGIKKTFAAGSILIPAGIQTATNWRTIVAKASKQNKINIFSLNTGLSIAGIDLGSRSFSTIKPTKVLLIGGKGVSQYEAGEVLFYLDDTLNIPVTVIEHQRLAKANISEYTHILMVDGNYANINSKIEFKLSAWVKAGGTLFAQKRAAKWLSDKELLKADFVSKNTLNQLFDTDDLQYQDKEKLAARKRIAGAIFAATLDTSHPLAFGYQQSKLPVFSNSTLIMQRPSKAFISVANYTESPLLSGYSDKNLVNTMARTPVIIAHNLGKGRVIASVDDLTFRGYWYGTAKILANSLFFAKAFNTPTD
jgi:zinc carboxypeptidase